MGGGGGAIGRQRITRVRSSTSMIDLIFPAIERGRYTIDVTGGSTFNTTLRSHRTLA